MDIQLGKRIKELRIAGGFTQRQIAQTLAVTVQAVSKWENELNYPDISLLPEIAELFGVTIDRLFR